MHRRILGCEALAATESGDRLVVAARPVLLTD
jgi:hypothetical protein